MPFLSGYIENQMFSTLNLDKLNGHFDKCMRVQNETNHTICIYANGYSKREGE